jgi:D-proline reductase (dithiol) PrdB
LWETIRTGWWTTCLENLLANKRACGSSDELSVTLGTFGTNVAVQLFRRLPWLGDVWARRRRFVESTSVPWTPVRKPVRESVVALVTTAGIHLQADPRFDMTDPLCDPSFRVVPVDTPRGQVRITHKYYDHSAADRDLNVVVPIDRLQALAAAGRVGRVAPRIYSFMGHIDGAHVRTLMETSAPEVARRLRSDGAEAVVLTPA